MSMSTKLVLPSVSELNLKFAREVTAFCSTFTETEYSPSYGRWVNSDQVKITARLEKSPVLYVNGSRIELPNYGEDLEEIVAANWGFIKHKVPQPEPAITKVDKFISDLLNLPDDMEEDLADNWEKEQILALA